MCSDCWNETEEPRLSKKQRRKARLAELEAEIKAAKEKQAAIAAERDREIARRQDLLDALSVAGFVHTGPDERDRVRQARHGLVSLHRAQQPTMSVEAGEYGVGLRFDARVGAEEAQALRDWFDREQGRRASVAGPPSRNYLRSPVIPYGVG